METSSSGNQPEQVAAALGKALQQVLPRLGKVTIRASIRLGHQRMLVKDLWQVTPGAIIPLQIPCDVPSELVVNQKLLATGTAVRNGTRLGFRLGHLVSDETADEADTNQSTSDQSAH